MSIPSTVAPINGRITSYGSLKTGPWGRCSYRRIRKCGYGLSGFVDIPPDRIDYSSVWVHVQKTLLHNTQLYYISVYGQKKYYVTNFTSDDMVSKFEVFKNHKLDTFYPTESMITEWLQMIDGYGDEVNKT